MPTAGDPCSLNVALSYIFASRERVADDTCRNTGLRSSDCRCLDCFPNVHRFKFLGLEANCETIDDIIAAIQEQIDYFTELKESRYRVGGAINDDYMEIYPPRRKGFYWGRCKNCGYHIELPIGQQQPQSCDRCSGVEKND